MRKTIQNYVDSIAKKGLGIQEDSPIPKLNAGSFKLVA